MPPGFPRRRGQQQSREEVTQGVPPVSLLLNLEAHKPVEKIVQLFWPVEGARAFLALHSHRLQDGLR